jgi:hypothetical protein
LQWVLKSDTLAVLQLPQEETKTMVNQPGKLASAERAHIEEPAAGQFALSKGGEEENLEQLLDQYTGRRFAEGEVMKGTVLKITSTDVVVDIGYKSEGVIPVAQFIDPAGHCSVKIGDVIDVLLEDTEDYDGHIVLSKEKAEKVKSSGPTTKTRSSKAALSNALRAVFL